ncbi:non-ribosomal peptide synthetase [Catellatospora tritici]|uniref:non-ribosomal peptide synthetase n=1 Tax=Catellatospora tritici TaxID=2851566 RepID=UPI001C2CD15A|nr:amino acid adenylation domain-containing protein [Catellatospora tritici]MBV1852788.1 amino acid adenylation domain-containing protein [Catellatospora tritici]
MGSGHAPENGHYSCTIPAYPSDPEAGEQPGELACAAALAAVETATRLSRTLPVRVRESDTWHCLPTWPDTLREHDGPAARAQVRELVGGLPADTEAALEVLLGQGTGRPLLGVRVSVRVTGLRLTADVAIAPGDPWAGMADAVAELFAEVVRALLADPHLSPADADGLGAASRQLLLGRLAGREVEHGPFRAIPTMIEDRVDEQPDAPALSYGGRTLTYREFDDHANALAAELPGHGVARGTAVPVLLGNSLELPVAYLALMKLGAAFVPLDPAWPADRLAATLEVLAAPVVLCADAGALPQCWRERALPVAVVASPAPAPRPGVVLGPDDVIYGIFTSGTTGTPKCAMNLHGGLTNRFRFMTRYFGAGGQVVLQNSRHTFDSSVWQLFWPLTTGGRTVVPAQGDFLDLGRTVDTIAEHGVTMTDFVPSIFNALVTLVDHDERALARISTLRRLIVGGEEMNRQLAHRLMALLPAVSLTNGYGPTEASIGMVFHRVNPDETGAVPLGRPIDNCYAVVVDEALRPLPRGAVGEIVIGGACLGSGYLGDPERTGQVFVANPFPEIPGDRLYRTGDLGRYDERGLLHFHGRRDFQVKIGGVRIELGEIETVAEGCPGVRQARVLVAEHDGAKSLALFVDGTVTEAALREHLRAALPRNSLPRHHFVLPELPRNANGKVDRAALHQRLDTWLRGNAAVLAAEDGPAPDEPTARMLSLFRRTLGRPELRADESFVRAGGDSLQALTLTSVLSRDSGVKVGVQDLFAHPTAERLSALLATRQADPAEVEVDEAVQMDRDARGATGLTVPAAIPTQGGREPRTVLVTGASGFVGSRLVHELLSRTPMQVVCLCRADDDGQALARVVAALTEQGLWQARFGDRLRAYAGDLGRPDLGLAPTVWDHLARTVDAVLHNGALVNFLFDYRAHRAANVTGTREVLRLALAHRPKQLHHVSTLGVLDTEAARHNRPLGERFDVAAATTPHSGYGRSKWVAERLLAQAAAQGAPVTIYRLGEVMPDADNGFPNRRALTHLMLSAYHRLGVCPGAASRSDYTPVGYVARRVVAGLTDPAAWGRTLHVFHPESVCFGDVLSRVGRPIERIPNLDFLARLREAALDTGDAELNTLLMLLKVPPGATEHAVGRRFGGLLTDNPRLFAKDECRRLEQRWGLSDEWLYGPIAAYRDHLDRHLAPLGRLDLPALAPAH